MEESIIETDRVPDTVSKGVSVGYIVIEGFAEADLVKEGLGELEAAAEVEDVILGVLEFEGVVEIEFEILGVLDWLAETVSDFVIGAVRVFTELNEFRGEFELLVLEEPVYESYESVCRAVWLYEDSKVVDGVSRAEEL